MDEPENFDEREFKIAATLGQIGDAIEVLCDDFNMDRDEAILRALIYLRFVSQDTLYHESEPVRWRELFEQAAIYIEQLDAAEDTGAELDKIVRDFKS